jgi:hypothetical protein
MKRSKNFNFYLKKLTNFLKTLLTFCNEYELKEQETLEKRNEKRIKNKKLYRFNHIILQIFFYLNKNYLRKITENNYDTLIKSAIENIDRSGSKNYK